MNEFLAMGMNEFLAMGMNQNQMNDYANDAIRVLISLLRDSYTGTRMDISTLHCKTSDDVEYTVMIEAKEALFWVVSVHNWTNDDKSGTVVNDARSIVPTVLHALGTVIMGD